MHMHVGFNYLYTFGVLYVWSWLSSFSLYHYSQLAQFYSYVSSIHIPKYPYLHSFIIKMNIYICEKDKIFNLVIFLKEKFIWHMLV